MHFVRIYLQVLPLTPDRSSLPPYFPLLYVLYVLFFLIKQRIDSNLCWSYTSGCLALHWNIVNLPRTTSLKKTEKASQKAINCP